MKSRMNQAWRGTRLAIAATSLTIMTACTTVSNVTPEGTTQNPVFPDPSRVHLSKKQGVFPNAENLVQVRPGMTKDQMYHLLGRPHFNEGVFGVREWDYVFHFPTPGVGGDGVTTCQFKVLYDSAVLTRSFFWKPVAPANASCPPVKPQAGGQRYTLAADGLFQFGRADLGSLDVAGRQQLDTLATHIKQVDRLLSVRVVGHADRIGSRQFNRQLSSARANTVATYLAEKGVPQRKIRAQGVGASEPVVRCADRNRPDLIACLAPNRRVQVVVEGSESGR